MHYRQFMLDEFTPIALYEKIKELFPNQKSFLFESVVNTDDGNFSYIVVGGAEELWYEDGKSFYKKDEKTEEVDANPLLFFKKVLSKDRPSPL